MTNPATSGRGGPVLALVDGTALAYRSHYAFIRRPLTDDSGRNVSALYGFATSLLKILDELEPSHAAVAFDRPEPTFRHEEYEDYKATREAPPDELIDQLPDIQELVGALGLRVLELPGYEADDVIGTLAVAGVERGFRPVIVSGDKDFLQLVSDEVSVVDPRKDITYDPETVVERFGVSPERVVDVLALMGDTSDNVPGVPGIGKKTAVSLVREFGAVEDILENIESVGGTKRREKLTTHADDALRSRSLVTIATDAPVEVELDELELGPFDGRRAADFFRRYGFNSLVRRVAPGSGERDDDYRLVDSLEALDRLVGELGSSGGFAVDLETTSLDPISADIAGVAVSTSAGKGWYVPIGHESGVSLDRAPVLDRLGPLLEDPTVEKYGQNLKFDYRVLMAAGVTLAPISFDTMIASYLLDPGRRQHGLDALAMDYLSLRVTPIEELIGKGRNQLSFDAVPSDGARDYACEDADVAYRLTELLRGRIEDEGLGPLLRDVELRLVPVLAHMEQRGVLIDAAFLDELGERFGGELDDLRARICDCAGVEFNIDSPKQVGEVLFERLGLPKGKRTKTGYSTDVRVLEGLRGLHEVPELILSYRQLIKLKSGYLDALPKLVHPETGRVHTTFNQTVASTGRLSSSDPNLQNIPIRTELGRQIRKAFIAERGRVLLSADYSQIELRLMAHLSGDETLIRAFREGKDVHLSTAALILAKDESDVEPGERDLAKTVNFGIMYGMSPYGLARQLSIDVDEAADFIERYFETYPGVAEYTDEVVERAAAEGYATTILGRKRPISGLDSENARIRGLAERTAVNTPIQGSAADMIKVAMIGLDERLASDGLPADMVLQVHDELVLEVDADAVEHVDAAVREEMEAPAGFELDVPIVVNTFTGPNWYEAH
ncbi:MAG: DNA polymerase I [Candidatus Eisenbacteria bacterium]|nr:DNA polymerase I [Candidatus Eisenbacteria bacterium]